MSTHPELDLTLNIPFEDLIIEGDELVFSTEDTSAQNSVLGYWRVLVVDDEPSIHTVTELALRDAVFQDRGILILHAYSGQEAMRVMDNESDIAMVFLDVVMENDHAGLDVVTYIRKELGNSHTRIVLRTGQPGLAPEMEVIRHYDIDDYKEKTELTADKLFTALFSALRAYAEIMRIESIVQERTEEIAKKNDELKEMNESIIESIQYAVRIQSAILPTHEYITKYIPHFSVIYKPKDIVSGDIYWFTHRDGHSIVANIDCTGHGVPGAIMSVFAYNLMNYVVDHLGILDPSEILNKIDDKLYQYFTQQVHSIHDGMDMTVLVYNQHQHTVHFASANRPVFAILQGEFHEFAGNKHPIGDFQMGFQKQFNTVNLHLAPNDRLYLFTDGVTDQFGYKEGERQKKYSTKRLKERLIATKDLCLQDQLTAIYTDIETWKAHMHQTDDISFIGLQPIDGEN
jgi:phosphoserine phosphatase RsbU/P